MNSSASETPKRLLVVAHAPSTNTQKLLTALMGGASHPDLDRVHLRCLSPQEAQPDDLLKTDALILGTPENLGYMSGLTKDFFDRCYYPCLEKTQGLPFAYYVRAGHDGTGTCRAIDSVTSGLRWRQVREPLVLRGDFQPDFLAQCESLGLWMAASLDAGII